MVVVVGEWVPLLWGFSKRGKEVPWPGSGLWKVTRQEEEREKVKGHGRPV